MEIPHFAIVNVVISLSTLLTVVALNDLGYCIENCDESPGIYYENKWDSVLFNIAWRTFVYVKLNNIDNETVVLRQCVLHVDVLRQCVLHVDGIETMCTSC